MFSAAYPDPSGSYNTCVPTISVWRSVLWVCDSSRLVIICQSCGVQYRNRDSCKYEWHWRFTEEGGKDENQSFPCERCTHHILSISQRINLLYNAYHYTSCSVLGVQVLYQFQAYRSCISARRTGLVSVLGVQVLYQFQAYRSCISARRTGLVSVLGVQVLYQC